MSKAKILIVEDEAIVVLDLTQRLSRLGYQVVGSVAEGERVAAAVVEKQPDLVLMDIRLAGALDGIAAAQEVQRVRETPIVYLTAHSDLQTLNEAFSTAPFGYILKPFEERDLHTQLEIALYRRGAEQRVRDSEAQLRAIMDTAQDGNLAIDHSGKILSSNPAAGELFGYGANDLVGMGADLVMPGIISMIQLNDEQWFLRTSGGEIIGAVRELSGRRKDGGKFPIELTVSTKRTARDGNFIAIVRNISRRKQLEDKLRSIVSDLRETDRRKDEFLALLSHELRNPLAPIRNAASILKNATLSDPKLHWCVEIIDSQVGLMTRLMEDLLDVSRISRGSLLLRRELVDFREMIGAIVACGAEVEAAGHKFTVDLPDYEVKLDVDPARLSQILANLISNAAKYMDGKGEVRFTAKCERDEMVIRVQDSGIGISADLLPHVFEMFRQGDSSLERSRGGLGIGLALVKSLVELHGGTVAADSAGLGKGSMFTVRLPLASIGSVTTDSKDAGVAKPTAPEQPRPKQMLIVDDNKLQAESLGLLLQLWGYEVRLAYDGPGALALLNQSTVDVALIDIGLPGMNGYEIARYIREQPQWRGMMLIAQSGWGRDSDREKTGDAGFDHHLTKPIDHGLLEKILTGREGKGLASAASR
jgi:PAS domain S-box-containing protein